jgi:hypothetical protein
MFRVYFGLFNKWITTGVSITELISLTCHNISTKQLSRYFHTFLKYHLKPKKLKSPKHIYLKIDAKHFGRWGCVLVFKESQNILYWQFCERENYRNWLSAFYNLIDLNYIPLSITSDKHKSIISAVKTAFPDIPHQYCLVHIQRRCKTLLTKKPETLAGRELLDLAQYLNKI